jgi:hypothetical protein
VTCGARYKSKWKYDVTVTSEERKEARYWRRKGKREEKKRRYNKYGCFDWVFSYKHLYKSFKKCCRNVGWKSSTQSYKSLAPLNVYRTYKKLHSGKYRSKGFFEFNIIERGKKRHIRSVIIDERVVQRCLCDYCLVPLLSMSFIYDNGASLQSKGYHFARKRITIFLRKHAIKHGKAGYALLFDFSKFFDNISHELCKRILRKSVKDPRIIRLTEHFIDMFGDVGLGLGSQVSQIFALAAVNELDHMIKEELGIKFYERYMDDGCLIHENKSYLTECLHGIQKMCDKLGIKLNKKKTTIIKLSKGFTWLKTKFYILDNGRILRKMVRQSVTKMRQKLRSLRKMVDNGMLTVNDVYMSFQSWQSYAKGFDAHWSIMAITQRFLSLYPEF